MSGKVEFLRRPVWFWLRSCCWFWWSCWWWWRRWWPWCASSRSRRVVWFGECVNLEVIIERRNEKATGGRKKEKRVSGRMEANDDLRTLVEHRNVAKCSRMEKFEREKPSWTNRRTDGKATNQSTDQLCLKTRSRWRRRRGWKRWEDEEEEEDEEDEENEEDEEDEEVTIRRVGEERERKWKSTKKSKKWWTPGIGWVEHIRIGHVGRRVSERRSLVWGRFGRVCLLSAAVVMTTRHAHMCTHTQ